MKKAPRLSCQSPECDHSSKVYSENSILLCDSCTRPICVHCAAGLPNEISLSKTEEMITLYKSVGSIFVCHDCQVLKRQKTKAHTHDWGVLSFFSMKHVTLEQIQAAELFSFSSLTRRRFPNGSSAISAVLDRSANAVCAVGNYGSATGTPSDYRILTRQTNSFGLNKVDQKELKSIINAQLGGKSLPHRILLLLPYVPFSKSKEFTDHLSPREILCLSLFAAHFCEFSGSACVVIEVVNGITGRALRPDFLRALISLCSLFGITFLIDEALTSYRCSSSITVPDLGFQEPKELLDSDSALTEESKNCLRSWYWQERHTLQASSVEAHYVPDQSQLDRSQPGAVNASIFEYYLRILKYKYGIMFEYASTSCFINKTGSCMVLSKGIGAGDLLVGGSSDILRESLYFPSIPNVSDQVQLSADMALVNFHEKCIHELSTNTATSRKDEDSFLGIDNQRPQRRSPTHGSQVQGMAFVYDKHNVALEDTNRSPGRTFFDFYRMSWDSLKHCGSIHTAVENTDKMEKIMTSAYARDLFEQSGSPIRKRISLRLRSLLCEQGTSILKTFKTHPFNGNIDENIGDGASNSGTGCSQYFSKEDCNAVFVDPEKKRNRVNSDKRESQYHITALKTNRPGIPYVSISSIRSLFI